MKHTLLIIIIAVTSLLRAEFDKVATTAGQFLKLGVGARAMALGGSYTALAEDGSSCYWNPAGLTGIQNTTIGLYHNPWVLDIDHDFISLNRSHGRRWGMSLFLSQLRMGEQEVTTVEEPDGTGLYYSSSEFAVGGSIAYQISDRMSIGGTLKYIHLSAYNEDASTFAVDIGSRFRTDFNGLVVAMTLANFGGEIQYSGTDLMGTSDVDPQNPGNTPAQSELVTDSWPLPLQVRIGTAMNLVSAEYGFVRSDRQQLIWSMDAVHPNDGSEYLTTGLEYGIQKRWFLRSGYRLNHAQEGLTFGAGARLMLPGLGLIQLDYAVVPFQKFGDTAQLSLEFIPGRGN